MLFPIAKVFTPSLHDDLHADLRGLHKRVNSGGDISRIVKQLEKTLGSMTASISTNSTNRAAPRVLDELVVMGASGQFQDYIAAEQAVMAIDMLLNTVGNRDDYDDWLDSLYDSVQEEDQYDPGQLAKIMKIFPPS